MKLLIIIDSLGSGGAERSTAVLCEYLTANNVLFSILCLDKKEVGVQQEMEAKGYDIQFLYNQVFPLQVQAIARHIKKGSYDLVHSILYRANIRTRFAKLLCDFTHLESLVNTTYSEERFRDRRVNQSTLLLYKWLDKMTASWGVDHFHSVSETVKQHYIETIKLDQKKITVIPRGRKPILMSYRDKPKTDNEHLELINVGRHEFQKGQIFLLKAIKVLWERGYPIKLRILGREGSTTGDLKSFIEDNQLEDVVTLEGFRKDVPAYLVKADLFVFPSLFEGLGGALIEAQAAGLPIACTDIPVLHEVVNPEENAKLFDVHDTNSIVNAIAFFLDNEENRKRFGNNSLLNFFDKFLEAPNNNRLINFYRKLY